MTQKMTQADASRIAAATAKQTGRQVPKDSFAARALSAASSNQGAGWPSKNDGMPSGGGRENNPPAPRR